MRWFRHHKTDEAEERLAESERELERVHGQWPRVNKAAHEMKAHAEVNGFAELIREAMGVGHER